MRVTEARTATLLHTTRQRHHPSCVFCAKMSVLGFHLDFIGSAHGISTTIRCAESLCGYDQAIHGGIVASLLDAAMTNALFARGVAAVTATMQLRYHRPMQPEQDATLTAQVDQGAGRFWRTSAALHQDRRLVAVASARFIRREESSP